MPKSSFNALPVTKRDVVDRIVDAGQSVEIHELSFVINGLRVAGERFREDARTFQEIARQTPEPGKAMLVAPAAARSLAIQFDLQARQMEDLAALLGRAASMIVLDLDTEDDA